MSPFIKKILSDYSKKEEEKLVVPDKKSNKKDSDPKTPSKAEKVASDKGSDKGTERTDEKSEALEAEEEQKRADFMKSLERIRKENFNMVLYGIPDVYMAN